MTTQRISTVRFVYDLKVDAYRLVAPYNEALVRFIKATIPASDRAWDSRLKVWVIAKQWRDRLAAVLTELFGPTGVIIIDPSSTAPPAPSPSGDLASAALDFVLALPEAALKTAYRQAAMLLHPDRGGSPEAMSRLNSAWERLTALLRKGGC